MNKLFFKSCPLCRRRRIKHTLTCTDFSASNEQFELFACEDCGFTFTQGFPSGTSIDKYYQSSNYISHSDTNKGIINSVYHQVRKHMLRRKVRLVIRESHRSSGRLLDIGTGTGYFANAMKRRKNWEVEAVEKNADARAYALNKFGLEVKPESALKSYPEESFDVITLWHVMEHIEELKKLWDNLYRILTSKGILIVAVPNRASYDAKKYGAQWAAYDVPRHLWHFTPATIHKLAARHGFIMAERYPMPFDAFYVSMLSEKYRGSHCSFIKGLYTGTMAWFSALAKKEKSSSMIYIFRKKTK
ncbi:MAG: class I SAM-dependent methyltransferase [Bacteroides sp.]|nr:class I SAM-dependent methyltransferase [Bacteroides sp.]